LSWQTGNNLAMQEPVPRLILASTSKYRRELLQRLRMPFDVVAPATDESPLVGESAAEMSERLAMAKAQAVAVLHPAAIVIGSDQVAECEGEPIGKPHTYERAVAQLRQMSGRSVAFHTAVAVVHLEAGYARCVRVPVEVRFRTLSDADIQAYLRLEQPYDCAGSAKCETLGISLLDAIRSDDPTALIGLPLIATSALLREVGADPLRWAGADHEC
jgi:septum formation protein